MKSGEGNENPRRKKMSSFLVPRKIFLTLLSKPIQLYENNEFFCWDSAILLSNFLLANAELITSKVVMEMGSGVGLIAIVLAILNPKLAIITDGQKAAMEKISQNLKLNEIEADALEMRLFVWGKFDPYFINEAPTIDVVISADIFYDENDFDSIFATFEFFARKNPQIFILSAYQVRSAAAIDFYAHKWKFSFHCLDPKIENCSNAELQLLVFAKNV